MEVKKKLLDLVRDKIRFKHYSYATERTYVHWIKHYILFHHKKYLRSKLERTMIYTHVVSEMNKSKVMSPLDF
ncbi:MAG: hypothetical protein ACI9TV_002997 [Sulfurimonas sp.]|jgi:hypothetical protein|uniref:phage integrase N-terminal SAM-like domain-containing protein n=1 Tax=Sulfurimonas sp. TaxID=2022749 RepID=UPI0039E5FD72